MMTLRLQAFLIIAMFAILGFFIFMLRKKMLDTKYSLIWLFSLIAIIILCLNPSFINDIASLLGVYNAMNALLFIAIAFLTCICISLTVVVSRLSDRLRALVQAIAIMEKEHNDTCHTDDN